MPPSQADTSMLLCLLYLWKNQHRQFSTTAIHQCGGRGKI